VLRRIVFVGASAAPIEAMVELAGRWRINRRSAPGDVRD